MPPIVAKKSAILERIAVLERRELDKVKPPESTMPPSRGTFLKAKAKTASALAKALLKVTINPNYPNCRKAHDLCAALTGWENGHNLPSILETLREPFEEGHTQPDKAARIKEKWVDRRAQVGMIEGDFVDLGTINLKFLFNGN